MDNDDIVDGEFNRTVANYDGGIIITDGTTIKSYVPFQGHKKNLFLISKRDSSIFVLEYGLIFWGWLEESNFVD